MDKADNYISGLNHNITLSDRKNIIVTGVKKIESFDDEEFLMDTSMGYMIIKGEGLEVIKLDTYQGNVSIKGKINSLSYMEKNNEKKKSESMIGKLFK